MVKGEPASAEPSPDSEPNAEPKSEPSVDSVPNAEPKSEPSTDSEPNSKLSPDSEPKSEVFLLKITSMPSNYKQFTDK